LLQHLQCFRGRTFVGLAEEQVDVFRHYNVTDQLECMPGTYFVKDSDEATTCLQRSEKWTPMITTKGDEVQIALAVMAF
jgi:hypothetical protein